MLITHKYALCWSINMPFSFKVKILKLLYVLATPDIRLIYNLTSGQPDIRQNKYLVHPYVNPTYFNKKTYEPKINDWWWRCWLIEIMIWGWWICRLISVEWEKVMIHKEWCCWLRCWYWSMRSEIDKLKGEHLCQFQILWLASTWLNDFNFSRDFERVGARN